MRGMSILTSAVILLMAVSLVFTLGQLAVQDETKAKYRRVVAAIRPRHLLLAPLAIVCVIGVAYPLSSLPILEWGWWSALGGQGSIVSGQTDETSAGGAAIIVPVIMMTLLGLGVPLLAHSEEETFRSGLLSMSAKERGLGNLKFGLVHLVMGIPIGVALALSLAGWFFSREAMRVQRRLDAEGLDAQHQARLLDAARAQYGEGVRVETNGPSLAEEQSLYSSAALHAVYNWLIVGLVLTTLIATA